ncbi:MAG: alpha/beta hydrolase [Dinghuibacter sp.]|nr:alpha/beta hydrolase [Dinghuibacter sp.]
MLKKKLDIYLPRIIGAYLNTVARVAPRYAGKKAVTIFCTPRKGRIRPKDEAALAAFSRKQLTVNGITVQCYEKGNGAKTILFAHGWESNAARWKRVFDLLERGNEYRIVAIDGPGHGGSGSKLFNSPLYAQFIQEACAHFRPDILVGHSIGAASIVFYLTHLEAITPEKLVLMGSPSDFPEIAETYSRLLQLNKRSYSAMMQHFRELFNMEPEYYSIRNFVKQLTVPGVVVHDTGDAVSPFANATAIAGNWKGAKLVPVSGSGHSLNTSEALELVVNAITQ